MIFNVIGNKLNVKSEEEVNVFLEEVPGKKSIKLRVGNEFGVETVAVLKNGYIDINEIACKKFGMIPIIYLR